MMRLLLIVAGLGLVAGSWWAPADPITGGGHQLHAWWVAMAGAVALVVGWAWPKGQRAAIGAGLLAGITAAALGMTKPVWLQHPLLASHQRSTLVLLALGLIGAQAVAVMWMLRGRLRQVLGGGIWWMSSWRAPLALVLLVACAAHLTPYAAKGFWLSWAIDVVVAVGAWLIALGALIVFATSPSVGDRASCGDHGSGDAPVWERLWLPWACAAFVGCFAAGTAYFVLDAIPHIPDGIAYLFQAKTFAAWRVAFDVPPEVASFDVYLVDVVAGRWFAVTPPGWPAVLAVGEALGVPWIVNPILGALTIPVAHALTRRLANRMTADLVAILMATSPWLLFLSASFMTHAVSLLDVLLAWLLLLQVRDGLGRWRGFAAGALMGHLFLVRPLDGVVVGGLTGLFLLFALRRRRFETAVLYGVGCAAIGSIVFAYNHALTGGALTVPIQAYTDRLWYPGANALGFGPDVGNPPQAWGKLDAYGGHGWRDVALNANQNAYNLNFELFGWAIGGLLLPTLFLLRGRWDRRDAAAATLLAALLGSYSLYWFSGGPDYGARYWYLMLFPVLWFAVRGFGVLEAWASDRWPGADVPGRLRASVTLLCLISILVFLPWRMVGRYHHYRTFHAGYRDIVESGELGNAVVFVEADSDVDYACAFIQNDPTLPGDRPIFLRDHGPAEVKRVAKAFPGRPIILVRTPAYPGGPVRFRR